jgi:hypothetical protein
MKGTDLKHFDKINVVLNMLTKVRLTFFNDQTTWVNIINIYVPKLIAWEIYISVASPTILVILLTGYKSRNYKEKSVVDSTGP